MCTENTGHWIAIGFMEVDFLGGLRACWYHLATFRIATVQLLLFAVVVY
jgi:hypothetical protein